ncbi:hypothetical protein OAF27_00505 [Verrucomicrobiales bacterium]|nr:hypothetical protein [Verrucomicrobiales bacterium]
MKSIRPAIFILLAILLGFAVYASLSLSIKEWKIPGSCPSIGPVPACYLVLAGFGSALVGHLTRTRLLFILGLGLPTLLAVIGTVGQLSGFVECPKTPGGTPMCFLSLAICSVCWGLWITLEKTKHRS